MTEEAQAPRSPIAVALDEFASAWLQGAAPDPDEFCRRHPECGPELRRRLQDFLEARPSRVGASGGLAAPPPAAGEWKTLGDFRIVQEIGRGGMGVVYLAHQLSLRRSVALKVLPAHLTLQPETIARFEREASMAARLRHPGIVEVYAVGSEGGHHFYAMELVEGTPLDRVLAKMREEPLDRLDGATLEAAVSAHRLAIASAEESRGGGTEEGKPERRPSSAWNRSYIETTCGLVVQVAEALDHAHRAGVLHRDVKPANILVRDDGSAVLTDFGLAREEGLPSLSRTGEFAGTPYYVSPEQAMGRRVKVDHRADLYSLGVTLYELLTLRRPFEGRTTQEVLGLILTKEPANPRRWNPLLPRDLVTIILKAIEKDPDRRYQDGKALAADLRAFLSYKPIAARPESLQERAWKFARRHRAAMASACALLLGAAGWGVAWWLRPGLLTVTSPTPGATVFVDGVALGTTPLESLSLRPGLHRIRMEKGEDLFSTEEEILVERGRPRQIERALASRHGILRLESDPAGARITLLDGKGAAVPVEESTPALLDLRAGRYTARFELEGFEPREKVVEVGAGGMRTDCDIAWETGRLDLEGFREGVEVEVHRGERVDAEGPSWNVTLPLREPLRLPSGAYSMRARLPGHDRRDLEGREAVHVAPGSTTRARIWLPPLERRFEVGVADPIETLLLADVDGDGVFEVVGGTLSGRVLVFRGDGSLRAEARIGAPVSVLVSADFDGRGLRSLVAGGRGESGQSWSESEFPLVAMDGGRKVRFAAKIRGSAVAIEAGDTDGDGRDEVFVATAAGRVVAFDGEGKSRFDIDAEGVVSAIARAQLDSDAAPEIVASTLSGSILALEGDGTRKFEAEAGGELRRLAAVDLDRDGRDEIVAGSGGGHVYVLGPGGALRTEADAPGRIAAVVPADLDGDGTPQIVVATQDGTILALGADGTTRLQVGGFGVLEHLLVADFDGDGRGEILAANVARELFALAHDGSPRFRLEGRASIRAIAAGDIDGDGFPEIVGAMGEGRLVAFAPDRERVFEVKTPSLVWDVAAADLLGDGRPEIVVGSGERVLVLGSDGARLLDLDVGAAGAALALGDLDGDGSTEIVAGTVEGRIHPFSRDGKPGSPLDAETTIEALALADLDGGGKSQVVVGTGDGLLVAFRAPGEPRFEIEMEGRIRALLAADLDGDGRQELLAGVAEGRVVGIGGDGIQQFELEAGKAVLSIAVGELLEPGVRTILAGTVEGDLVLLPRDGPRRVLSRAAGPVEHLSLADADGDGRPEILVGTGNASERGPVGELLLVRADGSTAWRGSGAGRVTGIAAADVDQDGRPEIVSGDRTGFLTVRRLPRAETRANHAGR
jgi:serine/threonine protein kinase